MTKHIEAIRRLVLHGGQSRCALVFHLVPRLQELCRGAAGKELPDDHPWDSSDFSRCQEVARHIPRFQERLPEMSAVSAYWAVVARDWWRWERLQEEEIPLFREYNKLGPRQRKAAKYPWLVSPAMSEAFAKIPKEERGGWSVYGGVAIRSNLPVLIKQHGSSE